LAMSATAFGADVAKISGDATPYPSLRAAIAVAKDGDIIELTGDDGTSGTPVSFTDDATGGEVISIKNKSLTIDGKGHTVYGLKTLSDAVPAKGKPHAFVLEGKGDVTIKNLKFTEFGSALTANNRNSVPIIMAGGEAKEGASATKFSGTLTLEGVSFDAFNCEAIDAYAGTLIVDGCTITGTPATSKFQNGIFVHDATVTIKGDTKITGIDSQIANEEATAVYVTFKETETATAGTYAYESAKGTVTIEGGTFETNQTVTTGAGNYAVFFVDKAAIGTASVGNTGKITINGGTFKGKGSLDGKVAADVYAVDATVLASPVKSTTAGLIEVSGGTFKNNLDAGCIAKGYKAFAKDDGTYMVRSAAISDVEVGKDGKLEPEIEAGKTATLTELLNALDEDTLATVTEVEIDEQITSITNEDLKKLENLESLDLSAASALTTTSLDLAGVKADTVMLSEKTNLTVLSLDETSDIKTISADGAKLESLALAGNDNIETVNVANNTALTKLDAAGCEGLKTLNTKGSKLKTLIVVGCTALTDLDASAASGDQGEIESVDLSTCTALVKVNLKGNRLPFLEIDTTKLTKLSKDASDFSGQKSNREISAYISGSVFDLRAFFEAFLKALDSSANANDVAAKARLLAANVSTVDGATYDKDTGKATFTAAPEAVKYHYNAAASAKVSAYVALAADTELDMDVTLGAGSGSGDGDNNGDGDGDNTTKAYVNATRNNTVSDTEKSAAKSALSAYASDYDLEPVATFTATSGDATGDLLVAVDEEFDPADGKVFFVDVSVLEAVEYVEATLTDADHNPVTAGTESKLAEGTVTAGTPYAIVEATSKETPRGTGSSGGGCNAGFAGLAALAVLALIKKSR
ncbi:MAG: leucine-rich repeat domain-containing protein, partial [Synergistaceae bacterium]|nr:leucine-rich repeat domain-containing protein [Synergistaceae bacterium]